MPLPTIIFGILLALLLGAMFHLARGGSAKRLLIYLGISLAGFWLGDIIAYYTGWSFIRIGVLNAGLGTIFSIVLMAAGEFLLNRFEPKKE